MKCNKTYFGNEKEALNYISKLKKTSCRDRKPVDTYLCTKCLCWHLTSIEPLEAKEIKYLKREIENLKAKLIKANEKG